VIGHIGNGVRLFPDINRPGYVPTGRLSGFGWPNLLAYWKTNELSFHQPVVPFTIVLPLRESVRISVDGWQLQVPQRTYVAVPTGSELRITELVIEKEGERAELLVTFCNPTFVRNVWQRDDEERVRLFAQLSRARDLANAAFHLPLTVDKLAAEAGLSKYHFIRLFDSAFRATPYRYLHELRLEHARKRLEAGVRDIGALCEECGSQSLGSFSWAFKRRYGSSPRNFAIPEKSD
jgi:AraC-like DNA-binding protein